MSSLMEGPETHQQFEIREGIAFLIDLSEDIFAPVEELGGNSQLLEIVQCVSDLMSDMVITFPSNGVGFYFYNARDTGRKFAKDSGINKIFSLNDLNSSNMKLIHNIVRDQLDGFKPLKERFPPATSREDNLHTVLESILREFQAKPHYNRKRLFWITGNNTPYVNPKLKDGLRTLMGDFDSNKIFVTPLFLETDHGPEKTPKDFLLFENIFLNTNFMPRRRQQDPFVTRKDSLATLITTVSTQIRQAILRLKEVRRTQFSCDLVLSDGPGIGGQLGCSVKGYTLFNHETVRPFRQVNNEGEGLKLVHNDTRYVREDTKEELTRDGGEASTVFKGFEVKPDAKGGSGQSTEKPILLTQDSVNYIRDYSFDHTPGEGDIKVKEEAGEGEEETMEGAAMNGDVEERKPVLFSRAPYLKLLCFRDLEKLQPLLNIKAPVFVTADSSDGMGSHTKEGGYTNSFETFRLLYRLCVRLGRYAVLFGCVKKNAGPRLYALYPTNTKSSTSPIKDKRFPDGFLLVALPWVGEIRSLPEYMLSERHRYFLPDEESVIPGDLASVYLKLVDMCETKNSYNPDEHPNPVLNFFYKTIKQEALGMDIKDEDTSVEHNDWTARRLVDLRRELQQNGDAEAFMRHINVHLNKIGNAEVAKRMHEDNSEGAAKRVKAAALTEAAVVALWQTGSWSKATVAQLKQFMAKYPEIPPATRKADMVSNITAFLETKQADE